MKNDGKGLESFVRDVEKVLIGASLELIQNRRVYSDDGVQLAELDLEIKGMVNGRPFHSLIECRDRPSQGKAPASWVQQLAGRRLQFGFDKVVAVSTMGFSDAAIAAAKMMDVELRQLSVSSPPPSRKWIESPKPGAAVKISCRMIQSFVSLVGPIIGLQHSRIQVAIREGLRQNARFLRTKQDGLINMETVWNVIWHREHSNITKLLGDRESRIVTIISENDHNSSLSIEADQVCARIKNLCFRIQLIASRGDLLSSSLEAYHVVGSMENRSETLVHTPTIIPNENEILFQMVNDPGGGTKYRVGIRTRNGWRPPSP